MPINTISLITGALSFSAALTWNKAITDKLNYIVGNNTSSLTQAIVITLIIIMIVVLINLITNAYTKHTGRKLKTSVLSIGNDRNSKVKLWLNK